MGAIDLSTYYTSVQTDAAIAAALVPVTLNNAPAWSGNTAWNWSRGASELKLHRAARGQPPARILCDAYDTSQTFTQAETNSAIAAAIAALPDYVTQGQVDTSITSALVPSAAQVDAEIAANGADLSDYYTKTESDNRYFVPSDSNDP